MLHNPVVLCVRDEVVPLRHKLLFFAYVRPPFVSCGCNAAYIVFTASSPLQHLVSTDIAPSLRHCNSAVVGGNNLFPYFCAFSPESWSTWASTSRQGCFSVFSCETGEATNSCTSAFLRDWIPRLRRRHVALCKVTSYCCDDQFMWGFAVFSLIYVIGFWNRQSNSLEDKHSEFWEHLMGLSTI